MRVLIAVGVIVVLLAVPAILKPKGQDPLVGPTLSEMSYTEVSFTNETDNIDLAGMLFIPDGPGPYPAAAIIHGSGTSRRDNTWYLSVVNALRENGIAVLLPDKRGSEKSEGEWRGTSFEELANDTLAAVDFLHDQDLVDVDEIGVIGMSQGGWIAPIVAARSDDVAWIVDMVGATVTPEEQLVHEETYNIAPYTYTFIARAVAPVTAARLMKMDFFQPWAGYDPIPYWKEVAVPVFFAFGGDDPNVPVKASVGRLRANSLDHHRIEVYPGGGHAIRDPESNEVSGEFLRDLVAFAGR